MSVAIHLLSKLAFAGAAQVILFVEYQWCFNGVLHSHWHSGFFGPKSEIIVTAPRRLYNILRLNSFLKRFSVVLTPSWTGSLQVSRNGATFNIIKLLALLDCDYKNPGFASDCSPDVFENLNDLIQKGSCKKPFPYIPNVTKKIEWIFKVC